MSDHPPLRIAVTCLSGYGGSTVIASELAAHLAERGHRVWLVSARRPGRARDVQGLSFVSVQAPAYPALEQAPFGLALAGTLVRLTRVHQLDLVHAHYAIPYAPAAWMARHALGAHVRRPALVATLHGSDVTHLAQANVYQEITRAALLAHEARTAPSRFLAAEAASALGLPTASAPVEVIGNFVQADRFAPAPRRDPSALDHLFEEALPGAPTLVHISNFRPVKRVRDVLRVAAAVRDRGVRARLLMIGDGPEMDGARRLAAELGLGGAVCFAGIRDDGHALLPHCAALLLPSSSESFGLVALEAMSCATPVIASHVGGLPEVVEHGVTGWLAPMGDVAAMTDAAVALLTDPERVERAGAQARRAALERWSPERAVDAYVSTYRRALEERDHRAAAPHGRQEPPNHARTPDPPRPTTGEEHASPQEDDRRMDAGPDDGLRDRPPGT